MHERITVQDAENLNHTYEHYKEVFVANNGEVDFQGKECVICNTPHNRKEMKYCECDKGFICQSCCSHCDFSEDDKCIWE